MPAYPRFGCVAVRDAAPGQATATSRRRESVGLLNAIRDTAPMEPKDPRHRRLLRSRKRQTEPSTKSRGPDKNHVPAGEKNVDDLLALWNALPEGYEGEFARDRIDHDRWKTKRITDTGVRDPDVTS